MPGESVRVFVQRTSNGDQTATLPLTSTLRVSMALAVP